MKTKQKTKNSVARPLKKVPETKMRDERIAEALESDAFQSPLSPKTIAAVAQGKQRRRTPRPPSDAYPQASAPKDTWSTSRHEPYACMRQETPRKRRAGE